MLDRHTAPTDASILAYELRDFRKIMNSYRDGITFTAEAMPLIVATFDELATRAERIFAAEEAREERAELKDGLARIRRIVADAGAVSQDFDACADRTEAAIAEGVSAGNVVRLMGRTAR